MFIKTIVFLFLFLTSAFHLKAESSKENWINLSANIQIDIDRQIVKVPVEVINHSGGLEFIITIGKVKDYESVFGVDCLAKELHLAMVTVGFETQGFIDLKSEQPKEPEQMLALNVEINQDLKPIFHYLNWNGDKPIQDMNFYFAEAILETMANAKPMQLTSI